MAGQGEPVDAAAVRALEARVAELESRLAFQEHALGELSDALAASRLETARSSDLLDRALAELKQLRYAVDADPDPGVEPPPPHY